MLWSRLISSHCWEEEGKFSTGNLGVVTLSPNQVWTSTTKMEFKNINVLRCEIQIRISVRFELQKQNGKKAFLYKTLLIFITLIPHWDGTLAKAFSCCLRDRNRKMELNPCNIHGIILFLSPLKQA